MSQKHRAHQSPRGALPDDVGPSDVAIAVKAAFDKANESGEEFVCPSANHPNHWCSFPRGHVINGKFVKRVT